jgi:hypothetical protein
MTKQDVKVFFTSFFTSVLVCYLIATVFERACHADQPSVVLSQGQAAPFPGILIDVARGQRLDDLQLDYTHLQKVDSLKDQDIQILNDRVNNANKEVQDLSSRLSSQDNSSHWKEVGMFLAGAAVTGLMGYGMYRVAH